MYKITKAKNGFIVQVNEDTPSIVNDSENLTDEICKPVKDAVEELPEGKTIIIHFMATDDVIKTRKRST